MDKQIFYDIRLIILTIIFVLFSLTLNYLEIKPEIAQYITSHKRSQIISIYIFAFSFFFTYVGHIRFRDIIYSLIITIIIVSLTIDKPIPLI